MPLMLSSFARYSTRAAVICLVAGVWGCRPSPSEFYDRTFACDETVGADRCGTTQTGEPMTCFAARQLGGQDFCTATCDGDVQSSSTAEIACLESKAELRRCRPSQNDRGCGQGLSCFRTDLVQDEGVCLVGELCSTGTECPTVARTVCATTLLRLFYPQGRHLAFDHLNCVQALCHATGSSCLPGESCLPDVLPPQSGAPDICAPQCDAQLNCPPNYFCYQRVSGPSAPAVCLPGLLGFRCNTDNDCLLGSCVDVPGLSRICSLTCSDDDDCARYDGPRSQYVCVPPAPGAPPRCMTTESFGGSPCASDTDCAPGARCTFYSPYHTQLDLGSCLVPCNANADLTCPKRSGIPHTCFDYLNPPVCYPGKAGLYCRSDSDCVGGLSCLTTPEMNAGEEPLSAGKICTVPCQSDDDCASSRFTAGGHWCLGNVCVLPRPYNHPCSGPTQCQSGSCVLSDILAEQAAGIMKCTRPPGGAD